MLSLEIKLHIEQVSQKYTKGVLNMAKLNDFEKIAVPVATKCESKAGNPYKFAREEVNEFIGDDEDKLLQIVAECEDYHASNYNVILISMTTLSVTFANCMHDMTKATLEEPLSSLIAMTALGVLIFFGNKMINRNTNIKIGAKYVKVVVEEKIKELHKK